MTERERGKGEIVSHHHRLTFQGLFDETTC